MENDAIETRIQSLGEAKISSPMLLHNEQGGIPHLFVSDDERILINIQTTGEPVLDTHGLPASFELAGPRR